LLYRNGDGNAIALNQLCDEKIIEIIDGNIIKFLSKIARVNTIEQSKNIRGGAYTKRDECRLNAKRIKSMRSKDKDKREEKEDKEKRKKKEINTASPLSL
jgi:hypothetical protein